MENNNSVCFVAKITGVNPIQGADNIERAVIGGWDCIVKKGVNKAGDLVLVATTDAVIPEKLSDEMNVTNYLRKGGRVRTVKLKGVYSECLIIPITFIPKKYQYEGADCMEFMGIFKYEPPVKQIQLASGRKIKYRDNPNFHIYYKFPNIKNVQGIFTKDDVVQITRKIHGTNARYGIVKKNKLSLIDKVKKFFRLADEWIDYEFVYGSHNVEKGSDSQGFYSTDVWRTIGDRYDIKNKLWNYVKQYIDLKDLGSGFVIYGEIYGAGIQSNYDYGLRDIEFAMFDVTQNGIYEDTFTTEVISNELQLEHAEVLYIGDWNQEIQDKYVFNNFIEVVTSKSHIEDGREIITISSTVTKIPHEGIVIKHVSGERNKVAKVINPEYLIYAETKNVGDSH